MTHKHILIIEDDPVLQRGLKDNFILRGHEVMCISHGAKVARFLKKESYDLIILDVMIPGKNGFEILAEIRQQKITTPVIMLSAKSEENDIRRGLELGANDYITKPFSLNELMVKSALYLDRECERDTVFEFGDFKLNSQTHELYGEGLNIPLMPKEYALLMYFIQEEGKALSRQQILKNIWDASVTERSVDRCVTTLRKKLGNAKFIKTVRDYGYCFDTKKY